MSGCWPITYGPLAVGLTSIMYEGAPAFPEPEYTFKHGLTQEVAYHSLLMERRKVLHERTAQAIEELYGGALDAYYGELAHHYGPLRGAPLTR